MSSVNKVILIGRLGQDPKLAYLPSGSAVCEMSVATSERYMKDGQKVENTEWHKVKVFGKSAEACANYLHKGSTAYIEGKLTTRSWEDQQGQKKYMTEVVVSGPQHTVQFMDSKGQGEAQPQQGQQPQQPRGGRDQAGFPADASGMSDVPFAFMLVPLAGLVAAMLNAGVVA